MSAHPAAEPRYGKQNWVVSFAGAFLPCLGQGIYVSAQVGKAQ